MLLKCLWRTKYSKTITRILVAIHCLSVDTDNHCRVPPLLEVEQCSTHAFPRAVVAMGRFNWGGLSQLLTCSAVEPSLVYLPSRLVLQNKRLMFHRWYVDDFQGQTLRRTTSEPQTKIEPATFRWLMKRSNNCETKTEMVSWSAAWNMCCLHGSHRKPLEGCRFDPCLRLRNRFSEGLSLTNVHMLSMILPCSCMDFVCIINLVIVFLNISRQVRVVNI